MVSTFLQIQLGNKKGESKQYIEQCDQTLRFSAKPADFEGPLRKFFETLM